MSTVVQLMQLQQWRDEALNSLLASRLQTTQMRGELEKMIEFQEQLGSFWEAWVEKLTEQVHSVRRDLHDSAKTRKLTVIKPEKKNRSPNPIRSSTYRRWKRAAAFEGEDM